MIRWLVEIAAVLSTFVIAGLSTYSAAPDFPEPRSVEAIAKAAGDPYIFSPSTSNIPQSHGVFSPRILSRAAGYR